MKKALLFAFGAILVAFAPPSGAQLVPDAPVRDFRLPMFGDDGYMIWDLRGAEARYENEARVFIVDMRLRVFPGNEVNEITSRIESPRAVFNIPENRARGDGVVKVEGPGYVITGEHWLWEGNEDRVEIHDNVRVVFQDTLQSLLR